MHWCWSTGYCHIINQSRTIQSTQFYFHSNSHYATFALSWKWVCNSTTISKETHFSEGQSWVESNGWPHSLKTAEHLWLTWEVVCYIPVLFWWQPCHWRFIITSGRCASLWIKAVKCLCSKYKLLVQGCMQDSNRTQFGGFCFHALPLRESGKKIGYGTHKSQQFKQLS